MPESIVSIGNNAFKDCSGMLTFECVKDSYSYEYAKKNGIYVEVVENGKNDSADDDIIVCTGRSFADSLSASALGKPILLVGKSLTYEQEGFMVEHENGNRYYIIGGTGAVDAYTENVIRGYGPTKRIGGSTRYETSVLVAEEFFDNPKTVVLAYAKNFPDGLSGGPLAYSMNAPLILTATNNYEDAQDYVYDHNINNGTILGGSTLISDITAVSIFLRF